MKCTNCPLLNKDTTCPGERASSLCGKLTEAGGEYNKWATAGNIMKFGQALIKHAAAGFPFVDQQIYDTRMAICKGCAFFQTEDKKCLKCGCDLEDKTWMAGQECPLEGEDKKWGPEEGKSAFIPTLRMVARKCCGG